MHTRWLITAVFRLLTHYLSHGSLCVQSTPLIAAIAYHNIEAITSLLEAPAARGLDLEKSFSVNNATPLSMAAYFSSTEIVEALVRAGADRTAINDHGATVLHAAVCNPEADHRMLDLIFGTDGKIDVNAVYCPLNRKWYLIDLLFMTMARCGDHSAFTTDVAHTKGSTALHQAAANGQSHLVEWLLAHGAKKSLGIKNKMGATPLDVARIFGPHPEVESLLSAAMLEANFASKYKVRRGSRVAISDVSLGADETGEEEEGAAAAAPAVAEEDNEGVETGNIASNSQHAEVGSLAVDSLEDEGGDQHASHTIVGTTALRSKSRGGVGGEDEDDGEAESDDGTITRSGLSALERQQEAMRREQEAMRTAMQGELDAVHGKLDAVLAWIAAGDNEARTQPRQATGLDD
mmetsp:Transcript_10167/g.26618  ORF Transcript_10167/g.26618 Transcript_10167/m.26618 type:complete len:406 (-) Transcript_10167:669-1886(-)